MSWDPHLRGFRIQSLSGRISDATCGSHAITGTLLFSISAQRKDYLWTEMTTVLPGKLTLNLKMHPFLGIVILISYQSLEKSVPMMPKLSTNASEDWNLGSPTCLEQFSWLPWNERPRNPQCWSWEVSATFNRTGRWEYEPLQYTYTYHRDKGGWKISTRFVKKQHPNNASHKSIWTYAIKTALIPSNRLRCEHPWLKFLMVVPGWNRPEAFRTEKDESQLGILSIPWM